MYVSQSGGGSVSLLGRVLSPSTAHTPVGTFVVTELHCAWANFIHAQWHPHTLLREERPASPSGKHFGWIPLHMGVHGRHNQCLPQWSAGLGGCCAALAGVMH